MLWGQETEAFIKAYVNELHEDNAAVFVGAGFSKAAGFVDWAELLAPLASDVGLDSQKEADLVGVAQYHVNKNYSNRHLLNQLLLDNFSDLPSPTENHSILARLPVRTIWTTNYDRLIEKALEAQGKRVDAKYTKEQLHVTRRARDVTVYKMHGDIEHPHQAILTRDDYEIYFRTHDQFITALAGDLVSKTFLFLGFSFTDPNLNYILSRVRVSSGTNQRAHYCIMKRRSKKPDETEAAFQYDAVRQELQMKDLMRFNVKVLLVDEYSDITEILGVIERRFRLRTIFISGSAVTYAPWDQKKVEQFLAKLAHALVSRNLRLSTGFGVGVGGAVVTGALEQIYSKRSGGVDDQLIMRPFPLAVDDGQKAEVFQRFREDLITRAGTAVFFLGNKDQEGSVVLADGMQAEFALAEERGLNVVPIGASGYKARQLWQHVMDNYATYFPADNPDVKRLFESMGKEVSDPIELLEPLLALLALLTKE